MNLADLGFLGFPTGFSGFSYFVKFLIEGGFDIVFIVAVLNASFSLIRRLCLSVGGNRV